VILGVRGADRWRFRGMNELCNFGCLSNSSKPARRRRNATNCSVASGGEWSRPRHGTNSVRRRPCRLSPPRSERNRRHPWRYAHGQQRQDELRQRRSSASDRGLAKLGSPQPYDEDTDTVRNLPGTTPVRRYAAARPFGAGRCAFYLLAQPQLGYARRERVPRPGRTSPSTKVSIRNGQQQVGVAQGAE